MAIVHDIRNRLQNAADLGLRLRVAGALLGLQMAAIVSEGAGVALLVPIFQYMQEGGDLAVLSERGRYWQWLSEAHRDLGLEVSLVSLLGACFAFILVRQVLIYVQLAYRATTRQRTMYALRLRAFDRYLHSETVYHDDTRQGELVNDLTTELTLAVNALYNTISVIGSVFLVLFYLAGLLLLSPWMTLISLGVIVVSGSLLLGLLGQTRRTSERITRANKNFAAFLVDRLKSIRLIRLSGTERAELDNLAHLSAEHRDQTIRMRLLSAKIRVVVEPVAIGVAFVVLYFGHSAFDIAIEALGVFVLVLMRLLPVVKDTLSNYQTVLGQWASLQAVLTRLRSMECVQQDTAAGLPFAGLARGIRYERVSLTYPGRHLRALDEVAFTIPRGRITAFVGPSGAGKSTLIDLLPRLREPDRGRVVFDDTDVAEFSLASLRSGIAYVSQAPTLFDISVREHIAYGHPGASEADIREAAALAAASEFIERLPQGYETRLGEDGRRLSGGQRQRLDLARALVRKAHILILDEPASHLDSESEAELRRSLLSIRDRTDITVILVAHQFSTVVDADQIIVLEAGRVTGVGTHEKLLADNPWYAQAFAKRQRLSLQRKPLATSI